MIISLFSTRVILQALGIDDYGIYTLVGSTVAIFTSMRGLFSASTQRFINYELGRGNEDALNKIFNNSVVIHLILSVVFIAFVEVVGLWFIENKMLLPDGYDIGRVRIVFQLSLAATVVTIMTVPFDATLIAHENIKMYSVFTVLDAVLKLLCIYSLFLVASNRLIIYGVLILAVSLLMRIANALYCKRKYIECTFNFNIDKPLLIKMCKFAGWGFLGTTVFAIVNEGGNMMLNAFGGADVNAARGVAYQVKNALYVFVANTMLVFTPQIIKAYAAEQKGRFAELISVASKVSAYLFILFGIPVFIFTDDILHLWLKTVPPFTSEMIRYIIIYLFFRSLHGGIDTFFKAKGVIKNYQIVESIVLFITLPIGYLLLRSGYEVYYFFAVMLGVEIINFVAIILLATLKYGFNIKLYLKKTIAPISYSLLVLLLSSAIVEYFAPANVHWVLKIAIILVVNLVALFFIGVSRNERIALRKVVFTQKTKEK